MRSTGRDWKFEEIREVQFNDVIAVNRDKVYM